MPCDRFLRSSHSSFPYSNHRSRSSSPSSKPHLLRLSSRKNASPAVSSTSCSQPSRHGLHPPPPRPGLCPTPNISTSPQIQLNGLPLAHSILRNAAITGTSSSDFHDKCVNPQNLSSPLPHSIEFSLFEPSLDTPVTRHAAYVPPNVHSSQSMNQLIFDKNPQFPLPAPDYGKEKHLGRQLLPPDMSTQPVATPLQTSMFSPPQSTLVDPASSGHVNYNCSTSAQQHPSYHAYHSTPRHLQVEQVSYPGNKSVQPSFRMQQTSLPDQYLPRQQNPSHGMFYQASNFSLPGAVFIDYNVDYNTPNVTLNMSDNNFMSTFHKETIPRAEFDSSDPNMPLRCHPGTRAKIIQSCQDFVLTCHGPRKLRWVVGAAGVGKSAIMQSVARESNSLSDVIVGATIFFSINGRQDGTKAITTIAYQLAVKLDSYRLFVQREVTRDPSLLHKSLPTQFNKFIIEPFIRHRLLSPSSRLLIIIDGLDECANPATQQELLGLISFFCVTYPSSPVVWMVASRPEPHITSFFSRPKVADSYVKEEILVDSDDAREDVKCYLRDKFREIKMASIALQRMPHWPSDHDFRKIASAAGGLFAYASTVIRYISDPTYGDPVEQLDNVLRVIETGIKSNFCGQDHPMTQLDALYAHIMSRIPAKVMANTRKLLLLHAGTRLQGDDFLETCNFLGMTENAAYGATHHIRSIAFVPGPAEATRCCFRFFHKSFPDYLRDFERSGFSLDIWSEAKQLVDKCAQRILKEALDGGTNGVGEGDVGLIGKLKNCLCAQESISLSWPVAGEDAGQTCQSLFELAVLEPLYGPLRNGIPVRPVEWSLLHMRVLATCLAELDQAFPLDEVRDFVFDEPQRREFLEDGVLKQVPLETVDYNTIMRGHYIQIRFKGPRANVWNKSCPHPRKGHRHNWSTGFKHPDTLYSEHRCSDCYDRLMHRIETRLPDHLVTVLNLTTEYRVVEFRFVDPEDGVSEWIYRFSTEKDIKYMEDEIDHLIDEYEDYDESDEGAGSEDEIDEEEEESDEDFC